MKDIVSLHVVSMGLAQGDTRQYHRCVFVLQLSWKSLGGFPVLLIYLQADSESLSDAFYFTGGFDVVDCVGLQLN